MRTIHKFPVPAYPGVHRINVTGLARWLDAGAQGDALVLWADIDTGSLWTHECRVVVAWTGQPNPCDNEIGAWQFLRTVQIGSLVHHVYIDSSKENARGF